MIDPVHDVYIYNIVLYILITNSYVKQNEKSKALVR